NHKTDRFGVGEEYTSELRHAAQAIAAPALLRMYPDAFEVNGGRRIPNHIRLEDKFAVTHPDPDAPLLDAPEQAHAEADGVARERIDAALGFDHRGIDRHDLFKVGRLREPQAPHRLMHRDRRALFQHQFVRDAARAATPRFVVPPKTLDAPALAMNQIRGRTLARQSCE